jgi:uncharacterized glyoxalase superfamily protein PhnB
MSTNITEPHGTIVPTLRYGDVAAAIAWLCNAFGFEKHLVVPADDGSVRYAELIFGNSMIMLGPVEGTGLDKVMQPAPAGEVKTQTCYLFVTDAAAHCKHAKAAGADILLDIDDAHSNGRGYSCRDVEGHVWNFGTYDPWKRQPRTPEASRRSAGRGGGLFRLTMAAGSLIAATTAIVMVGRMLGVSDVSDLGLRSDASASVGEGVALTQPDRLARERDAAGHGFSAASAHVVAEPGETEVAVSAVKVSRAQLAHEDEQAAAEPPANRLGDTLAAAETERALEDARQQLARERSAREEAQRGAQEARERLRLAERTSEAAQEQLAAERNARETAEIAAQEARQQLAEEQKEVAERALKEAHGSVARERAAGKRPPPRPRRLLASAGRRPLVIWDH